MRKRTVKPIRVPHGVVNAQTALKLPKGIHVHESGSLYICYKNEHGRIIRENTHQTNVNAAEPMLAQVRTDVAMKRRFTSLSFESVKFIDIFNDWWKNHGSRTRSKFEYRTPRVLARLDKKRAREITPDAVRAFLAKPNPRFRGNFKRPHAWDFGKRFRRVAKLAGVAALRIHDLRHFAASTLTSAGIEDNIIGLLTGHKSRELRRYQHLREELKRKTVDLIAGVLKAAGEGGNSAFSSRLLHAGKNEPKDVATGEAK